MTTDGGGWTLVGQEISGVGEHLAYLGVETGTDDDLLQGGSALIGVRFAGKYTEVRITWLDGAKFIQLTVQDELFENSLLLGSQITAFETNDTMLSNWVTSAGGAKFCRAAVATSHRPGDTSWAVKPLDDHNIGCGCNSGNWAGRGVYYTGLEDCDACTCWGPGSFVGVKSDGEQKAGLTDYRTRIFIR